MYYVNFTEHTGAQDFYEPKPTDLTRIPRPSAKWFHKVATTKCLDGWSETDAKAATASHKSETSIFGFVFGFVALATVVIGVVVVLVYRHRRSGYEPIVSRN
ncbi:hypothetical protein PF010_g18439 [Phytophthora fragariae]|nr:hypothetical protein PF010_g18439 [Phytophthora fragariae]KAE9121016.1 hypothetical protein PF006_g18004 [Phytophthora fragariae]KAE9205477.1 hypothetical protein PF002_g20311 [Phytophthora fragariae]KAE9318932.1 hypothetical protein PF008_g18392 [Phytophthora fragariae]